MVIDFEKIEELANPQFKGGVGTTYFRTSYDGHNKIMRGRLEPGCSIGYHVHETNIEILYIISGDARCVTDEGEEFLSAGMCQYCAKGHGHGLINNSPAEPLIFFAVVTEQ